MTQMTKHGLLCSKTHIHKRKAGEREKANETEKNTQQEEQNQALNCTEAFSTLIQSLYRSYARRTLE